MQIMNANRWRTVVAGALSLSGFPLAASVTVPETALYADLSVKGTATITDGAGETATLSENADLVVTGLYDGNTTPTFTWKLNALYVDASRSKGFWHDKGSVSVGAGGITFLKNAVWMAGRLAEHSRLITITADQEWNGTETDPGDTLRAALFVGSTYGTYFAMGLGVADGVSKLTVGRYLDVWFTGQNTRMGNLALTVEAPARLHLVNGKGNPAVTCDGRLACRSLTLVGDGDALRLGTRQTAADGTRMYLATDLDAAHFAPVLNLTDGADIAMGTTYASGGIFAVPSVNVTKRADGPSDGVSALTGPFTVTQAVTTVTFTGGATLDLTGAELTESGVSAGWVFAGEGTARFSSATDALTGGIDIGPASTVVVAGAADLTGRAVTGSGTLAFDPGADATAVFEAGGFSGTVKILSGGLVVKDAAADATVVAAGGTVIASGAWTVTDAVREEMDIVVGPGETLTVYGDGLTAATRVVLDGGDLVFGSTGATVASPVLMTRGSVIRSGAAGATNVISGFVTGAVTNDVKHGLRVAGDGCLTFAGGMRLEAPEFTPETWASVENVNVFSIRGGSVLLTNGEYDMGVGPLELRYGDETAWGRYLGIRDGARVRFSDPKSGRGGARSCLSVMSPADQIDYNRYRSRLEIGTGGSLELPWNCRMNVGSNQSYAELSVDGGELLLSPYAMLALGCDGHSTGDFILRAGTVTLNYPIKHPYETDVSRLLWYGGTIRLGSGFTAESLFADNSYSAAGTATFRSCAQILGAGCTLDLGACTRASVANVPAGREHAEWIGAGTLRVVGGAVCKTLTMNTFPGDVTLCLTNGVTVAVPDGAKVYDSGKSNYAWRDPQRTANGFTSTDGWLTDGSVHLAELHLEDATSCFESAVAGKPVDVGTVRVGPGGVFGTDRPGLSAAAVSFTNVTFETGATWAIGSARLAVPGTLTFGETVRIAEETRPDDPVLAAAGVALVGDPEVVKAGRRRTVCVFDAEKKEVRRKVTGLGVTVF